MLAQQSKNEDDSPNVDLITAFVPISPSSISPLGPFFDVISEGKIPGHIQLTRIFILEVSDRRLFRK